MTDFDLLQEYALRGSDAAFSTLVSRYANLVYSAALRQTGDWHTSQDVAQAVFITLARKAVNLRSDVVLCGWLLRTTRFVSLNVQRREARRYRLEEQALKDRLGEFDAAWSQIAPILDEALVELPEKDRDAVALRFFEQKTFSEIGEVLGTSEDGASKRVIRALDKLRRSLLKQGVTLSATLIVGAITTKSVQAAPAHVAAALANGALGAGGSGPASVLADELIKGLQAMRRRTWGLRLAALSVLLLLGILTVRRMWPPPAGRTTPPTPAIAQAPAALPAAGPAAPALRANPGQTLLRVVDAQTAAPIANALVTGIWDKGFPFVTTNILSTDQRGEVSISFDPTLQPLWNLRADIIKDGYVAKFVSWAAARGDLQQEIPELYTAKLERGTIVGGTVINEDSQSIAGVRIIITGPQSYTLVQTPATREGEAFDHEEVADSQGRWLCNHAPAQLQLLNFTLVHPEYRTTSYRSATITASPDAAGNRLSEQDFRNQLAVMVLKPGRKVTGVVTSAQGNPISSARVVRNHLWMDPHAIQTTGDDGGFRFGDLGEGKLILTVEAPGYRLSDRVIEPWDQPDGLHFSLESAGTLRLKVIDEAGHPVTGAVVMATGGEFNDGRFFWKAVTDKAGTLEWRSAFPESNYNIRAQGYESEEVQLTGDNIEHAITLHPGATNLPSRISGTVVDSQTRVPIEHFGVWSAVTIRQKYSSGTWNNVGFAAELKTTGQNGRFAFLAVDPLSGPVEAYEVEIKADGYLPARQRIQGPLTNDCNQDFELTAVGLIEGVVQAFDGSPVNGAVVMLCGPNSAASTMTGSWTGAYMDTPAQLDLKQSGASRAETDVDGEFKIQTGQRTGQLVAAHKLGFAEMEFNNFKSSVTLRLQPWGCVQGTLKIGPQPGINKLVSIHKITPFDKPSNFLANLKAVTDSDGRFFIEGVPPGDWNVSPHDVKIEVRPGETNRLLLGGTGRRVFGRITGGDPSQPYDKQGYTATLATKSAAEPPPLRVQFSSFDDYMRAKNAWTARSVNFQNSAAGRAAQRSSRNYSPQIQADGTFVIDEALPGDYVLSIAGDPLKHDPLTMDTLANILKEVTVSEAKGDVSEVLNIGSLNLSIDKNSFAR